MHHNKILSSLLKLPKRLMLVIMNFFIKHFITPIENIRFEIYFHYILVQTYRIFTSHGAEAIRLTPRFTFLESDFQ